MKNNKRLINSLAAGNILGLLMLTFFAFGDRLTPLALAAGETGGDSTLTAASSPEAVPAVDESLAWEAQLTALAGQNDELTKALRTMESREADFRQAITDANQTIMALEQAEVTARDVYASQNQELGGTVQALAQRESESRIGSANQSIQNLESQLASTNGALTTLKAQNSELVNVLKVMQDREVEYQNQIEAANQAMANMQGQGSGSYEEHEEHGEYEDYEEDDEHGEYEEHDEHGEYEEHDEDEDDEEHGEYEEEHEEDDDDDD